MQRASVYEFTKGLLIHPDRRVDDGYWVAVGPYAALSQPVEAEALGIAVLQALHHSGQAPEGFEEFASERLAALRSLGAPSESSLQRQAQHASVRLTDDKLTIVPYRNGGTRGAQRGFSPLPAQQLVISPSSGAAAVGAAIQAALALSREAP